MLFYYDYFCATAQRLSAPSSANYIFLRLKRLRQCGKNFLEISMRGVKVVVWGVNVVPFFSLEATIFHFPEIKNQRAAKRNGTKIGVDDAENCDGS
jgi:hypothetical protein